MQQHNPTRLLSFAGYARRAGVDRSTVSRWARIGIISTCNGRVDPVIADQELAANRPLPRGRAAWQHQEPSPALSEPVERQPCGWAPTPGVFAVLRAHGPEFLAARLAIEGHAAEVIAVVVAHYTDMLDSIISMAHSDPFFEAADSGGLPARGRPRLDGVDYPAVERRIRYEDDRTEALMQLELDTTAGVLWPGRRAGVD